LTPYNTTGKALKPCHCIQWNENLFFSLQVATNIRKKLSHHIFYFSKGIVCTPPHRKPANGRVDCSDGSNVGSQCDFTCNANYALNGTAQSVCRDDGDGDGFGVWSTPAPKCDRESICYWDVLAGMTVKRLFNSFRPTISLKHYIPTNELWGCCYWTMHLIECWARNSPNWKIDRKSCRR